jgi:hypothetical protein
MEKKKKEEEKVINYATLLPPWVRRVLEKAAITSLGLCSLPLSGQYLHVKIAISPFFLPTLTYISRYHGDSYTITIISLINAYFEQKSKANNNLLRTYTFLCNRKCILNPLETFTCHLRLRSWQERSFCQCNWQELFINFRSKLVRHDIRRPHKLVCDALGETLDFPAHEARSHHPHEGEHVCRKVFDGNIVTDLSDKLPAFDSADDVDAGIQ